MGTPRALRYVNTPLLGKGETSVWDACGEEFQSCVPWRITDETTPVLFDSTQMAFCFWGVAPEVFSQLLV